MDMSTIKFSFGERPGEIGRWPFRVAILAEFIPREYETGKPDTRIFHHPVDKDNFNEVMARAGMRLEFDIKNPLSDDPKELHIRLPLNVIKAFRPDYIVQAIPELKNLSEIRALLEELGQRKLRLAEFKERIKRHQLLPELSEKIAVALRPPAKAKKKPKRPHAPPAAKRPTPKDSDALDSILEMVEIDDETETKTEARQKVEEALDDFLDTGKAAGEVFDRAATKRAVTEVDALLNRAVNAILHFPEFRRVEAVWRGLKFLVDQTDFRKNIRLEIINADKDHLRDVFAKDIYQIEYDAQSEVPLAAVVAAYEFDSLAPDIDLLRDLVQKAAEIPVVVITSLSGSFLGLEKASDLSKSPYLVTLLGSPDYAKYNGLREDPSSRWLALVYNRFLLRYLYGQDGWRVNSFEMRESAAAESDLLWGNPVWALASLMTRSYARTGWSTEIAGRRDGGVIENLPVRSYVLPNGEKANLPLEAPVPDRRIEEFDRCGIIPLLCDINSDTAYILAAPSAHRPLHDSDTRKAEVNAFMASLPYQMYTGEIARFINRNLADLTSGLDTAEIETRFTRALAAFNVARDEQGNPGPVSVQIEESSAKPGQKDLVISVSSPPRVLHGRAAVQMSLPLRI